jgi:hypothetical protein
MRRIQPLIAIIERSPFIRSTTATTETARTRIPLVRNLGTSWKDWGKKTTQQQQQRLQGVSQQQQQQLEKRKGQVVFSGFVLLDVEEL